MQTPKREPKPKYKTLEEKFLAYSLNGQQRQGKVLKEAQGSNQFDSMMKKINKGY